MHGQENIKNNGMNQNRIAISSQVPIFNKYKNLKHKILKYNAKNSSFV